MKLNWTVLLWITLFPVSLFSNTLYFPQVAFGGGYSTTFVITNTGTTPVSSTLVFYDQSGIQRTDLSQPINLPAGNSTRVTLPNTGAEITVVWGQLGAGSGTVQGVATFDLRAANGTLISTAGVLGLESGNSFLLPVDVTSTASTGVAIANVSSSPAVVNLRLINEDGVQVGIATDAFFSPLGSRRQTADFVTTWFPQLNGTTFRGTLVVETAGGAPPNSLVATALTVKEGILSALPVVPSSDTSSAGRTLFFPQVAFGGGYSTTFVIMNTGAVPVSSTVNFYDQSGMLRADLSTPISVAAGGSARFTLPDTGPSITVVWGQLSPGSGTVKGVATFDLRASSGTLISTAGVLGLLSGDSFNFPVDVTGTSSTGVAIANTSGGSVNVLLQLLGEDGTQVASTQALVFGSRQQTADFVTEWFGQVVGAAFKGTLVASAGVGAPADSLIATALTVKEGILSALPVNRGTISGGGGGGGGGSMGIGSPGDQSVVIGESFALQLAATGSGTHVFTSVGQPLPVGLTLNSATGGISGSPTAAALLSGSPVGVWGGIVIQVSNGTSSAMTNPFTISVTGSALPSPYAYMPFDGSNIDDVFGRTGTAIGPITPGVAGVIGNAVFVGGTDNRIHYPTTLASQLNGKMGFTIASTIKTTSAGTMFFGLSDQTPLWSRVYAGLANGRIEFGGRSQRFEFESGKFLAGSVPVNDGQFHTFVGTMDLPADRISVYVDGMLDFSAAAAFNLNAFESFSPADGNFIGHLTGYADSSIAPNVTHDEVALWDLVLDANQAATVRWLIMKGISLRDWIGF